MSDLINFTQHELSSSTILEYELAETLTLHPPGPAPVRLLKQVG